MFWPGTRVPGRPLGRLLACVLPLLSLGCGSDDAIFVVLDFDQVDVPGQADGICLGLYDQDPAGGQFGQRYAIASLVDPTLAVDPGSAVDGRLILQGYLQGQPVALQQQDFDFAGSDVQVSLAVCAPGRADRATERDALGVAADSAIAVSQGPDGAWIVVASAGQAKVAMAGSGGLEVQPISSPQNAGAVEALVAMDVDGDCDDDVLVLEADGPSLWRRDRGALVVANELLPVAASPAVAAVPLDFNGDLLWDVALVGPGGLELWQGGPDAFTAVPGSGGAADLSNATAIAAADLDGDGHIDLAIARAGASDRVLYGTGTGDFAVDAAGLPEGDGNSQGIGIGDMDGDGVAEIVVTSLDAPVAAFARDASGTYVDRSFLLLPNSDPLAATGLEVADWNGDCQPDFLIPAGAAQSWASGSGAIVAEDPLSAARDIVVADLLGTGERDALLLSASSIHWWRR